ncbi:MAG: twin-arginine translocation signal domain-containing protein [Haloferacaceae archaeon]
MPTRRTFLQTVALGAAVGTAGCSTGDGPLLADGFEDGIDPWTTAASVGADAGDGFRWAVARTDERAHEGSWSVRVETGARGRTDDGTAWLVRPLDVPADATRLSVAVMAWSPDESFDVLRHLVVALRPDPPESEAGFPDPGVNSDQIDGAPYGGLREPLGLDPGWREYATSWAPDSLPDRAYLAVGVSVVRAADATHYLDEVLVTAR